MSASKQSTGPNVMFNILVLLEMDKSLRRSGNSLLWDLVLLVSTSERGSGVSKFFALRRQV